MALAFKLTDQDLAVHRFIINHEDRAGKGLSRLLRLLRLGESTLQPFRKRRDLRDVGRSLGCITRIKKRIDSREQTAHFAQHHVDIMARGGGQIAGEILQHHFGTAHDAIDRRAQV